MQKKKWKYALLLPAMFFLVSHGVTAQDSTTSRYQDNAQTDSLSNDYNQQEDSKDVQRKNSENLSDLKSEKQETKAKAREAQRVEDEASDAAQESRSAYRKEKKAQKSREQADKQADKAENARTKSDQN